MHRHHEARAALESFEQLAQTRYFLARPLWHEPSRHGDAIALAETALQATKIAVRRREIEAWLRGRPRP